jgi:hypothetical protein
MRGLLVALPNLLSGFRLIAAPFLLFIADIAWPFRFAAMALALSACEELAITLRLPRLQSNVRSYWHVARQLRQ